MKILFIAKPLSKSGNGVVSAMESELKYLQKKADVALFNIGVELDKTIVENMFNIKDYKKIRDLPFPYNNPDLVVFEEVYKLEYIKLYNECLRKKIPYVVIPHGCLVEVEQQNKRIKHIIANILLFNRYLKKAEAVQFLNEQEKNNSKFKYKKSIIIPNSIDYVKRTYKRDDSKFKFIYIGRYAVRVKGLDLLIKTFVSLKNWCTENNVVLELYGPIDENPELELLKEEIKNNKCTNYIKINGPVFGSDKAKKLQEAKVFIQTSRHEGQPMGIIEAMSYGLPCLVTYETSFGEYCNQNKCGIGVNFSEEELKKAIISIFNDKKYLKECEKNAIVKMKENFEIKKVTDITLNIYEEIVSKYR